MNWMYIKREERGKRMAGRERCTWDVNFAIVPTTFSSGFTQILGLTTLSSVGWAKVLTQSREASDKGKSKAIKGYHDALSVLRPLVSSEKTITSKNSRTG